MEFELSSTGLLLVVLGVAVAIAALIYGFRAYLKNRDIANLKEKYADSTGIDKIRSRNKYPEANSMRYSGMFWKLGLVMSLLLILSAFNWTQYEKKVDVSKYSLEVEEELEIEPPRTQEPPPPPPPPPPPVIEEVPDEVEVEEDPPIVDQTVEEEQKVDNEPKEVKEAAPPPPPPPPPKEEKIFRRVEQMPRFPGCENEGTEKEKKACAEKKLLEYIYGNVEYPTMAKENGVEGRVIISFVVDKEGNVKDVKLARDQPMGLGDAAIDAVRKMQKEVTWVPGRQQGKAVNVSFNLPVMFDLE